MFPKLRSGSLAIACFGAVVNAQTLVADIRPGAVNPGCAFDTPRFLSAGGLIYFSVQSTGLELAQEIWATDGTPGGARRLLAARGTTITPLEPNFTELPNGLVLFRGLSPSGLGVELWATDGTVAGTHLVFDIWPGSESGLLRIFGVIGNVALLAGNDGVVGTELWVTDGTAAGTALLVDIAPGPTDSLINTGVGRFAGPCQGRLFFNAYGPGGQELWSSDGTVAGTGLVADIHPTTGSDPAEMCVLGSLVLFAATDPAAGRELWRSDGTLAGTVRVADIAPGTASSSPAHLCVVGATCFFAATNATFGTELWSTDGFSAALVRDINPTGSSSPSGLVAVNGRLLFNATDGVAGRELWRSDGTVAGTQLVVDLTPGAASTSFSNTDSAYVVVGSQLVFAADNGALGFEPYVTDGTAAGTALLHDIRPGAALGSSPTNFVAQNSRVFFSAFEDVHGRELWTSDLTTAGTVLLHDLAPQRPNGAGITQLAALGDKVVFDANDGVTGLEPWVSDGTAAGTLQLGDLAAGAAGSAPRGFTSFLGKLYFSANGAAGRELWSTDGTPAGTVQVKDIAPGATGSDPRHFVTWHGALYFTAVTSPFTRTLWRTDGTAAGTVQVSAVAIVDFAPAPLIPLTNCLVIVGTGTLYRYDGSNPAVPVDSVNPVQVNYNAPTLAIGDWGYFFGDRGGLLELWRTDGTAAGTTHVYQFSTYVLQFIGGNYSLAALGDRVVVSANDKAPTGVGQELYVTDGTTAGTSLLRDISPGPASDSDPAALLSVPDRVFFTASDGVHGRELWSTDGTTAGTVLVADLSPGADGALASSTTVAAGVGRRAVIAASTPATGSELWITDGTAGGTQLLFELQPGPASGIAGSVLGGILPLLAQAGANVFFVGNDPNAGPELHVMPAALLEAAEAERIGQGCSGSPGTPAIGYAGVPALGDGTFALTVAGALAVTPAILAAADTRTDVPLPGGCTVYPTLPPITLGTLTSPLGVGAIGVPVPPTPALVGATLFFQWAVLDPNGAFANLLAFSDGLRIRVGKS